MIPRRDPLAERALLARAQHLARLVVAAWPSAVERRLALGQERYGDAWSTRSAADLLGEAGEEAEDFAAWSCLAAQQLAASDLDPDVTAAIGEMVVRAVAAAAEMAAYVSAAQTALRKATSEDGVVGGGRVTARKLRTHCKRGHPMTPENTYVTPGGKRRCRKCDQRRRRAYNRKLLAARKQASTLRKCVICGEPLPRGLRTDAQICDRPACVRARHRGYWRRKHGNRKQGDAA